MKIKKTTEVTIQTERVLIVRKRRPAVLAFCKECGAPIDAAEEVRVALDDPSLEIGREVDDGRHYNQLPDGRTLVCGG